MLRRLFPWRFLLRLAAKRFQVIDPLMVAARIRSFAQPSEVQEPIELLRAGIVFHARGLLNTKAIQHNLDWVWPYWVERQFNPDDNSFIPRAFSFSHINLTHRNWTAIGLPDLPLYPIVDPRGLVTPLHDGWSVDCWFIEDQGAELCPSRMDAVDQYLIDDSSRAVVTRAQAGNTTLTTKASLSITDGQPTLHLSADAESTGSGWLIFSLRPYNPEGVQLIERAALLEKEDGWLVDDEVVIRLHATPDKYLFSDYRSGDVFFHLDRQQSTSDKTCRIGMVTAAACYRVEPGKPMPNYQIDVDLPEPGGQDNRAVSTSWPEAQKNTAQLQVPDHHLQFLHDTAARTLIHLSAGDVVPGPYTYNRFWFRDACFMLNALLTIGLKERCRRHLDTFGARQTPTGFFHSQDGEWDSNGQVLWLLNRFRLLAGDLFNPDWLDPLRRGADWIATKRRQENGDERTRGLLPPGFSAEHFGPNDYYYWDDLWAVAGLQAAADTFAALNCGKEASAIGEEAAAMRDDVWRSIRLVTAEKPNRALPISPNRRLDSGAIGCLVADYPLQLLPAGDHRMMATADYLFANCLKNGCFFQDMIHSGNNIYMTLELAQVYLRAGDDRFRSLLEASASLASPTGQWPEAIHPLTGGGCMGDGQHGWAAAEWLMLLRNMFIMEEDQSLVIGRGILPHWLTTGQSISYGPTLTPYGSVSVAMAGNGQTTDVTVTGDWQPHRPQTISIELPGHSPTLLHPSDTRCSIARKP
ncbi:MAG: hypothetical protein V2J11_04040 [Desulfofustis sp.]|jgi:hypothetical protein|nr:hypothetical protein [Desulfofustis sp.]